MTVEKLEQVNWTDLNTSFGKDLEKHGITLPQIFRDRLFHYISLPAFLLECRDTVNSTYIADKVTTGYLTALMDSKVLTDSQCRKVEDIIDEYMEYLYEGIYF